MNDLILIALKWTHVLGACILIGTGAGIAFFMMMANRTGEARLVAHTTRIVVVADYVFTASAVVVQPISGIALARHIGWPLTEPWILVSVALYLLIGAFWLPVVWMQSQMRDLAQTAAAKNASLPAEYHLLYRRWFWCGFPAFGSILVILWLMIARPAF